MLTAAAFASKLIFYASSLATAGAAVHGALGRTIGRGWLLLAAAVLVAAAALRVFVLNAQMGGSLAAGFSADTFGWTWAGLGAQTTALVAAAVAAAAAAIIRKRILYAAAGLTAASAFGLAGHAAGLEAPGLAPFVVVLHVLIAAFWVAAPVVLWPSATLADDVVAARTAQFSAVAVWIVPLLFLSGGWLLLRLIGGFDAALSSVYGRLLLAKLLAAGVILAVGAINMKIVSKQLIASPVRGRKALRATLRIDAFLFLVVVLLVASATTFTGPDP